MTPCPKCDDISIVRIPNKPFSDSFHVTCKCGNAWHWGSAFYTKRKAKQSWEALMDRYYATQENQIRLEEIQND